MLTAGGRVRADGRTTDQMRPLKITPDFISTAEGSVLIELGNTRVICTATVDDGSGSAGRAYRMARLRRESSGWRNAHGVYHGSVRGAGAGIRTADRGG